MFTPVDPDTFTRLRDWVKANALRTSKPAYSAVYQSLGAALYRLSRFGHERGMSGYTARELINFVLMSVDDTAQLFLGVAFTRAVVEDDRELLTLLASLPVLPEFQAWLQHLQSCPEERVPAELAVVRPDPEERAVARLVLARRLPALVDPAWLPDCPPNQPLIAHQLAHLAAPRAELHGRLLAFLAGSNDVLFAGDPDLLLEVFVRSSPVAPQPLLAPFAGCYGERTVATAAEWHLEHGQPDAALHLASTIRPLSTEAERAATVAAVALLELGRIREAEQMRAQIDDPHLAAQVTLRLAERAPENHPPAEISAIGAACPPTRPELFFGCLRWLLAQRRLTEARELCYRRSEDFNDHPQVRAAITAVLRPGAAAG